MNLRTRILTGIAVAGVATTGLASVSLATRPASTSTAAPAPTVELVQPAADTNPATATPPSSTTVDTAVADRAETAAAHVDKIVATTTTVPAPAIGAQPTTPVMADPAPTTTTGEPETTKTTVAPKQWVEVGRFPFSYNADDPIGRITVTLQTGQLRVVGLTPDGSVWLGDSDSPMPCDNPADPIRHATLIAGVSGGTVTTCELRTDWPTGKQTLSGGRNGRGSQDGWAGFYSSRQVIVEEYR